MRGNKCKEIISIEMDLKLLRNAQKELSPTIIVHMA